jgi:hypothetical protein
MAEIRVERKGGLPPWAYVLIVVALIGLVIVGVRGCGTTTTTGRLGEPGDPARVAAHGALEDVRRAPVQVFGRRA